MARASPRPVDGELVLDATELTFLDYRSLLQLVGYADQHAADVVLRGAQPVAERLAHVMYLTSLRVEAC
jgi:anti-anti-sigma regulatory factor